MNLQWTSKISKKAKHRAKQELQQKGIRIFLMYILYSGIDLLMIALAGWRIYYDIKNFASAWYWIPVWVIVVFILCALLNASVNLASLDIMRNSHKNFPVMLEPLRLFFNTSLMSAVLRTLIVREVMEDLWNILYGLITSICKAVIAMLTLVLGDFASALVSIPVCINYILQQRKQISYTQAIYIQRDANMNGNKLRGYNAVQLSEKLMNDQKLAFWVFQISFALYFIPSLILLAIGGFMSSSILLIISIIVALLTAIFVWPYFQLAKAGYYQYLIKDSHDDENLSLEENMPDLDATDNQASAKQDEALDKYYGLK